MAEAAPGPFFLATKTGQRSYQAAKEEIHRSLERLGVDHVDLIQLHNLVDVIEWEFALREGGALEAAVEARDEGLVRFIGVTGHGLTVADDAPQSLERFPFDSVLVPYNYRQMQDEHYAADFEALAATCAERGVALQTIKSIALAPWHGRPQTASTWYEPLSDPDDIALAVRWVLGREGVFLNTVGDVHAAAARARGGRASGAARRGDGRAGRAALGRAAVHLVQRPWDLAAVGEVLVHVTALGHVPGQVVHAPVDCGRAGPRSTRRSPRRRSGRAASSSAASAWIRRARCCGPR